MVRHTTWFTSSFRISLKKMSRRIPKGKSAKLSSPSGGARTKISKATVKKDRKFVLTGVSAIKIILSQYIKDKKFPEEFGDDEVDSLPMTLVSPDENDIPLTDLLHEKSKRAYYFLDARKAQIKLWPNMVDVTLAGPLPASTTKLCWWDRHSFQTRPIGCPLRYVAAAATGGPGTESGTLGPDGGEKNIYETEGYFCSFPCCKAYIISLKSEMKYKESLALLSMMFSSFYGSEVAKETIPTAPTWKILLEYGGHLTIQEYKSSIGKLDYEETVNAKRSQLICSSPYIQERRYKTTRTSASATKTLKKDEG